VSDMSSNAQSPDLQIMGDTDIKCVHDVTGILQY